MKIFRAYIHLFVSLLLVFVFTSSLAVPLNKNIAAPDQKGAYNIGFIQTTATLTNNRVAPITIWYPTNDIGSSSGYILTLPPVIYPTHFDAISGASVAAGQFPMIVNSHGAGVASQPTSLTQIPQNELLASHGFIVVGYLRPSGDCSAVINDPRLLISLLLDKNNGVGGSILGGVDFLNKIDPNKIGAAGYSAGALATVSLASGNASLAIGADERVKSLLLYDPPPSTGTCGITTTDRQSITIPYLVMGAYPGDGGSALLFNETTSAIPRILVLNPNAIHVSYGSGFCQQADALRETSLARQQAAGANPLIDPLLFQVSPIIDSGVGARVFSAWNSDVIIGPLTGGARQFCNKVGVNSAYLPLNNGSGLTTVPPFNCSGPVSNLCGSIYTGTARLTGEQMEDLIYHYSVSFWKVFLEGDKHYMRFLTEGYANVHEPNAIVAKIDD